MSMHSELILWILIIFKSVAVMSLHMGWNPSPHDTNYSIQLDINSAVPGYIMGVQAHSSVREGIFDEGLGYN